MSKQINARFIISAEKLSQCPNFTLPEFPLLGRSNVGKSSFINMLCNRKSLARTSSNPGKTQTLNLYLINNDFYFVDVPGYGFAMVNKNLKKKFGMMIEEYLENRENLKLVFMLIDFRHKPTEDDVLMYNFLKHYNIPLKVVAMKVDKVTKNNRDKNVKQIIKVLNMQDENELILFSSITKVGKQEVYNELDKLLINNVN